MKFVIKSLLFVNLLLQMTSSLRKCFNTDQNLMLTIILLAFSLIGMIGLTVGNRFILIIFAACMTLILIASITIYAIGRTEHDANQPKVPYYTSAIQSDHLSNVERGNRVKSFVNKLLNRNQQTNSTRPPTKKTRKFPSLVNSPRKDSPDTSTTFVAGNKQVPAPKRQPSPTLPAPSAKPVAQALEDYSDESASLLLLAAPQDVELPQISRSAVGIEDARGASELARPEQTVARRGPQDSIGGGSGSQESDQDESSMVESQQWIAYERRLYERYLNMVSQSIDLVMLTILASWMALLLDEDSDQCFGSARSGGAARKQRHNNPATRHEAPIYNYNGVRYSIKPGDEAADSPSRVLVR